MFAFYRTLSVRYLRQRWSRTLLVIASIALGVTALVATRSLTDCMVRASHSAATPLAGVADLMVTNAEQGVHRDVINRLAAAKVPGVERALPLVLGHVRLPKLDGRRVLLIGLEVDPEQMKPEQINDNPWGIDIRITNPLSLLSGHRPVFVGKELLRDLPPGADSVDVWPPGQDKTSTSLALLGTADGRGATAALGGSVLIMRLSDAARVLGHPDVVTRIDLTLAPAADRDEVRRRVKEVIGESAQVRTFEANNESVQDMISGLETAFGLGGIGALVVGLFLVYNALSVTVAERRHDIGILRSVGATRGQIAALFVLEAALLGVIGSSLGVPLGLGLAYVSTGPIQQVLSDIFLPVEARELPVTTATVTIALAAGILTALLAALVPAMQAAHQEPADAVRRVPLRVSWGYRAALALASGLCVAAGILVVLLREPLGPLMGGPKAGGFYGLGLMLVGILFATPLLAGTAAGSLSPLARRFLPIEARLAADNLARSPGRTGLVIAALAAFAALMIQTAGVTLSTEGAVLDWIDQSLAADLFVTSNSPIAASGQAQPMSADVGRQIASLPEVSDVLPVRFQRLDFRGRMIYMIAVDAAGLAQLGERGRGPYARLIEPGTALVSENFAALHHVKVGERITLHGPRGPVELRIIGTVLDYSWNRGTVFMDRAQYVTQFGDPLVDAFDVYLQPGASPEQVLQTKETIERRWQARHELVVLTRQQLREVITSMVRRLYALAYSQQIVIGLVAGLGVVTALLISVLQRRRELGLLRAVGASRMQVLRCVLAEAILMGVIGSAIGVLLGIPLEWYALRVIVLEETGLTFPLRVPWIEAGLVVGLALTIATAAGLWPAIRAMSLRIPEAIAYE